MFSVGEIDEILGNKEFISDYNWVQQSLVNKRVQQGVLFDIESYSRLEYFVEVVLASSCDWSFTEGLDLCQIAGEIAETLSLREDIPEDKRYHQRFRAALLYELAGLPALANSAIGDHANEIILSFFKRNNGFQTLNAGNKDLPFEHYLRNGISDQTEVTEKVFINDIESLLNYQQGMKGSPNHIVSETFSHIAQEINLPFNASELKAFSKVLRRRMSQSTISNVENPLFIKLMQINFPAELWPAQVQAVKGGLLNNEIDSWGLASPTGTGKTFLTRMLIIDAYKVNPNCKILYLVPSRALVYEIGSTLGESLKPLGIEVVSANAHLVRLEEEEEDKFESASVVILTPEKADLLLRIGQTNIDQVSHVIVDEAHHIESDTRGILLELYLWRIRRMIKQDFRFIFLSAVAPNINDLTNWTGKNPHSEIIEHRATRMRAGVYDIGSNLAGNKEGWIHYSDGTKIRLLESGIEDSSERRALVQLADEIFNDGPVLTVAKGKHECEHLVKEMIGRLERNNRLRSLSEEEIKSEEYQRLDSRLEREMYPSVFLRECIKNRVAYHHAGLPPRVRKALEDLIRKGQIDFVFATTTLAEGVNFPFSSVIVQSLVIREGPQQGRVSYKLVSPRNFWNIAGRAGRPGFDNEGQVILFKPSLGLEKVNAVLDHYLNPDLKSIAPVKSALSEGINELYNILQQGELSKSDLNQIELNQKTIPRRIRGTINLLRVGLVHAKAAKLLSNPEEILESSFANYFISDPKIREFGIKFISEQNNLLSEFFTSRGAPSERVVAEMGLSVDTLERLKNYVLSLEDWQIKSFRNLFFGSELQLERVVYTIGPVAKNIAELEGERLGGFLSDLIVNWLSGVPLTLVRSRTINFRDKSLENLISVIYSRIQFLLPWGLFAVDSIVEEEADRRKIPYNNELRKLSYLSDAGVPSFDAYRLTNIDFERVDATRLYHKFMEVGGPRRTGVDFMGWIAHSKKDILIEALKGIDNRRLDYDLDSLIQSVRKLV